MNASITPRAGAFRLVAYAAARNLTGDVPLQSGQPKATDDPFSDGPTTFPRDRAAVTRQVFLLGGIDQIAFTECGPVQAIGLVEEHFMNLRLAVRSLRGAKNHAHTRFKSDAVLGGENNRRMRVSVGKLPGPNLPRLHQSSQEGLPWAVTAAASMASSVLSARLYALASAPALQGVRRVIRPGILALARRGELGFTWVKTKVASLGIWTSKLSPGSTRGSRTRFFSSAVTLMDTSSHGQPLLQGRTACLECTNFSLPYRKSLLTSEPRSDLSL